MSALGPGHKTCQLTYATILSGQSSIRLTPELSADIAPRSLNQRWCGCSLPVHIDGPSVLSSTTAICAVIRRLTQQGGSLAKSRSRRVVAVGVAEHGNSAELVTVMAGGELLDRRRIDLTRGLPTHPYHHE